MPPYSTPNMNMNINYFRVCVIVPYFIPFIQGFSNKIPPIFKSSHSNLQNLISSKAVITSLIKDLTSETDFRNLFLNIEAVNIVNYCLYLTMFTAFVFTQTQYYTDKTEQQKFMKITEYRKATKITQNVVSVFIFVLFRDIDSVV